MNVFEHQSFLLRRPPDPNHPLGERVRRTYRELMTGPDEELSFDYPLEHLNVAALGLCAALTQTAFEPATTKELESRIARPLTPQEFEAGVAPFREHFSIDGEVRFMQGRKLESDPAKNAALLQDKVSLTVSDFMNRPDNNWVVAADQIPLLLFARGTFYEKSAGRGYLAGTSGDLEVRTFLTHPPSLRKTIWLNVLACDEQDEFYESDFTPAGLDEGYDEWMWVMPPKEDVPQGKISLRSGLFWLVATNAVWIEELEKPRPCIVTGEPVTGLAGVRVLTKSTGIGYGVYVPRAKGPDVRLSFFRHPNGPYAVRKNKEGGLFEQHLTVDEVSGLLGNMGGLFFSGGGGHTEGYHIAPVLRQYHRLSAIKERLPINLHCFGFHMLSSKKNIHGGCESERFRYPMIEDTSMMSDLQGMMSGAATQAEEVRKLLTRTIQICMMVEVDASENEGRFQFKQSANLQNGSDYKGFVRDIGREYWSGLSSKVGELLERIGVAASDFSKMEEVEESTKSWWMREAAIIAKGIFDRYFDDYSQSVEHLPAAYAARNLFYAGLRQQGIQLNEPEQTPQESVEETA